MGPRKQTPMYDNDSPWHSTGVLLGGKEASFGNRCRKLFFFLRLFTPLQFSVVRFFIAISN